jgi:hypothetical protein
VLIEDIIEKFELDLSDFEENLTEFSSETTSYMLTHILERFPENGEIIRLQYEKMLDESSGFLEFKILRIVDAKIGKIEVKNTQLIEE